MGYGGLVDVVRDLATRTPAPTPAPIPIPWKPPAAIVPPTPPTTIAPPVTMMPPVMPVLLPAPTGVQPTPAPAITPQIVASQPPSAGGGFTVETGTTDTRPSGGSVPLLQQPAVLIGLAILGWLALRGSGGTRRY
jgi:hypothetical protein